MEPSKITDLSCCGNCAYCKNKFLNNTQHTYCCIDDEHEILTESYYCCDAWEQDDLGWSMRNAYRKKDWNV